MNLISSGRTDVGKTREINQDSFGIFRKEDVELFVVADGMGGYANGEKASQTVVGEISKWWDAFSPVTYDYEFEEMLSAVEQIIAQANKIIYTQYNVNEVCGTTVVALFIFRERYGIIYAGDSRCYAVVGRRCRCLTIDEIWENQSHISSSERRTKRHPNRGKLVNAVGIKDNVQCRVLTGITEADEVFMLCTDGLHKYCSEGYIKKCMRLCRDKGTMEAQIDNLIRKVYKNGADDNVTVVVVKCCK